MKWKNLIQYRGEIVDKLTHLDNVLCLVISKLYFGELRNDFIFDVLYEKDISVFSKHKMLKKIFKRKKLDTRYINKINRLLEIRNIFAHAWTLCLNSETEGKPSDAVNLALRENDQKEYDIQALKREFDQNFIKIQQYLSGILGADPKKEGLQTIK